MSVADAFGVTTTVADAFAKVKDDEGHNHGSDGKFTSSGSGSGSGAAKPKKDWTGRVAGTEQKWKSQKLRRDNYIKEGKLEHYSGDKNCKECAGFPTYMDGLRPTPKAKYRVPRTGGHVCASHALREVEGREVQWVDGKHGGGYQAVRAKSPGSVLSGQKAAERAQAEADKKAAKAEREKAAEQKKLAKPCKRRGPVPEELHSMYLPGADLSGRGPRGKFTCLTHWDMGNGTSDGEYDNDDDTRCHIASKHDNEKTEKSLMSTVADAFGASSGTVADAFAKSVDVVQPGMYGDKRVAGSMESFIATVRDPLIAGCGCPFSGELDETGSLTYDYDKNRESGQDRHYPNVDATFADRGIVSCNSCGKTWAVPFILGDGDKDSVVTGEPEERVQVFVSPEDLGGGDEAEPDEAEPDV